MNINEAKQILKNNGYIVETKINRESEAYKDWIATVHDELLDLFTGNRISSKKYHDFLKTHEREIEIGWLKQEFPKEYSRNLFGKYYKEL